MYPELKTHRDVCPHLPRGCASLTADYLSSFGLSRGSDFYVGALTYAQVIWLSRQKGSGGRTLLLLDRAFGADINTGDEVLKQWPLPYRALGWILERVEANDLSGNPRRHYQHLALRVRGSRAAIRTWRAWACLKMVQKIMPNLEGESVSEPNEREIFQQLKKVGIEGEAEWWDETHRSAST
jgi:hypothetical protein